MEIYKKSGLTITFDYKDIEALKKSSEPIYIYKDIGLEENNITMSIEEAEWLKDKLEIYIEKFKKLN